MANPVRVTVPIGIKIECRTKNTKQTHEILVVLLYASVHAHNYKRTMRT